MFAVEPSQRETITLENINQEHVHHNSHCSLFSALLNYSLLVRPVSTFLFVLSFYFSESYPATDNILITKYPYNIPNNLFFLIKKNQIRIRKVGEKYYQSKSLLEPIVLNQQTQHITLCIIQSYFLSTLILFALLSFLLFCVVVTIITNK